MKTIEELYQEWLKQQYGIDFPTVVVLKILRRAFFAGFNRAYNIANVGDPQYPMNVYTNHDFEREMDDFSEKIDESEV